MAVSLHEAGMAVFPCDPSPAYNPDGTKNDRSKKPLSGTSWRSGATSHRRNIDNWWRRWPDAMPGIDLGKSSLLVVDLDEEDGVRGQDYWDRIVAENGGCDAPYADTPSGGRHVYFRQPDGLNHGNGRGNLPPKKECPIDIRGTGGYVIAPGAHRDDGIYEPGDGDPLSILDAPVMPDWLVELLTKRPEGITHQPQSCAVPVVSGGQQEIGFESPFFRNVNSIALQKLSVWVPQIFPQSKPQPGTGAYRVSSRLLGRDLQEDLSLAPTGIVDFGVHDMGDPRGGKRTAIDIVMDYGGAGDAVAAANWLCDVLSLDPRALGWGVADEAEIAEGAASARTLLQQDDGTIIDQSTGEVIETQESAKEDAFPDHLTRVPGLVGQITDWIEATARRPSRVAALGAALTVTGTVIGRKLCGPTQSATHLYVLNLAGSGAGKDHALNQAPRLLAAAGMSSVNGPDDFMSHSSLIARLTRAPLTHCAMDEFGAFIAKVNHARGGPHVAGISKILRTAWGKSFASMTTPEWASRQSEIIQAPALSILGVSTPDEFFEALKGKDVINGFLNRFLVLPSNGRPKDRDPLADPRDVPEEIVKRMEAMFGGGNRLAGITGQLYADPASEVRPVEVPWADDHAREIFRDLQTYVENLQDRRPDLAPFYARTAEMAVRMATIRAAGENMLKPSVSVEMMQWGRDLALWSADRLAKDAGLYMAETDAQANANKVLRLIQENGGRITRRDLLRRMQHTLKGRDLDDTIKSLKEAEQIVQEAVASTRRPVVTYFLTRD
nr:bifunctional DNA primase/polymerase [Roseibium sp. RKSG952]